MGAGCCSRRLAPETRTETQAATFCGSLPPATTGHAKTSALTTRFFVSAVGLRPAKVTTGASSDETGESAQAGIAG